MSPLSGSCDLDPAALEIIGRLESNLEVERSEGYGLYEELERGLDTARPGVKLIPSDPEAAPLVVVFTTFPGLHIRFGRWYGKPFPGRGCDESAERGIERLNDMVDDVTAGRFRESIEIPPVSFPASGWVDAKLWSPDEGRSSTMSRSTSRVDRIRALEMSGGRSRLELDWTGSRGPGDCRPMVPRLAAIPEGENHSAGVRWEMWIG